jgi:hypothetical protein
MFVDKITAQQNTQHNTKHNKASSTSRHVQQKWHIPNDMLRLPTKICIVGQTSRRFHTGYKEHIQAVQIKNNFINDTNVDTHNSGYKCKLPAHTP